MMRAKIIYGTFTSVRNQINAGHFNLRCDCHFNSTSSENINYSLVEIKRSDGSSMDIARDLSKTTTAKLNIKSSGVRPLSSGMLGYIIVKDMDCPTILWEPCFGSSESGANIIKNKRSLLHDSFLEVIRRHLPSNAQIALVPGHAHKRIGDPGASLLGGGNEAYYTEILVQELASLINATGQEPSSKKGRLSVMCDSYEKEHRFAMSIEKDRVFWLNLGNDLNLVSTITIYICFHDTSKNFPTKVKLEAYSTLLNGLCVTDMVKAKYPNFSGPVMVTAKAVDPFMASKDTTYR